MKNFILTLSILLVTVQCFAQTESTNTSENLDDRKGYLAIMLGPSFPVGDYADDDLNNDQAGLAKTGFSLFLLDFGYKFHRNIGIAASWFGGSNPVDAQVLADGLAYNIGGAWTVESGAFSYGGLFVGPMFSIPLKKVDLDLRVVGGFATGFFPEIKVRSNTGVNFNQESANGSCFAYSIGAGTRVHFSKKLSFIARVDYIAMTPETEVTIDYVGGAEETFDVEQPMNTVNLNLGLAFRLK